MQLYILYLAGNEVAVRPSNRRVDWPGRAHACSEACLRARMPTSTHACLPQRIAACTHVCLD